MIFQDRGHAAQRLATELSRFANRSPLVLGVPNGGVPMARVIADTNARATAYLRLHSHNGYTLGRTANRTRCLPAKTCYGLRPALRILAA